jgi:4-amino-4-deoxy-L-arabinose transferase-like glycosyltransferase
LRSMRRLGAGVFLTTVVVAGAWALLTPTFQAPDESEHFGAVQYFGETGKAVAAAPDKRRPSQWSTQEAVAIDATHELLTVERQGASLPWLKTYELAWQARTKGRDGREVPRDNGGGYHPAVSSHTPAYYALASSAYVATKHHSAFAQVLAVRWLNALLGGLTALFAFLAVAELLPRRRAIAVAGGLLVCFEPMFGFMAGAINNDNAVNAACAAVVFLCVRGLRRGLTWRVALGLGVAVAIAPIFKGTGYELMPPALLAVALMLLRGRRVRPAWIAAAVGIAGFLAVEIAWDRIAPSFGRSLYATPGGGVPTGVAGLHNLGPYANWMWQILVPYRPPFLKDLTVVHWPFFNIYVKEGFAAFGWYAIEFPKWVYGVILLVMVAVGVTGLRLVRTDWAVVKARLPELLFLVSVPVTVVFAVEAAYINVSPKAYDGTPEQGRYLFPALAALAALTCVASMGAGRRRAVLVVTALVAALMGLTIAGQILMFQSFYS